MLPPFFDLFFFFLFFKAIVEPRSLLLFASDGSSAPSARQLAAMFSDHGAIVVRILPENYCAYLELSEIYCAGWFLNSPSLVGQPS